jgi:hypothetical protein
LKLLNAGRMMADLFAGDGWVLETRLPGESDGDGPVLRTVMQGDADCVVWASPEALARPELCQAHLAGMAEAAAAVRRFRKTVRWSVYGGRWAALFSCGAGVTGFFRAQALWFLIGMLAAVPGFLLRPLVRWQIRRRLGRP